MTNTDYLNFEELIELNPEEREAALKILSELSEKGKSEQLDDYLYSDFDEIPVDIHTFLHDKHYLGNALYDQEGRFTLFPYWEEKLKEIFPSPTETKYNTIVFTGAIGLGKSTIAVICLLYMLYRLLCLKDPYLYYGMQPIDKISISLMNITLENAKGVALDKMNLMILSSQWFLAHGEMAGKTNLEFRPEKHIEVIAASSNNQVIGRALFCLDGNTIICTENGDYPMLDLIDLDIRVKTIDNDKIVLSDLCLVKPTGISDVEYLIELADGSMLKCTPNHRFMLKDGTYKEALYLTEDDELFEIEESIDYDLFINNIINNRGQWGISDDIYFEGHHIIPRCLGGVGKSKELHENIIRLYPCEHLIAHKLLLNKYPDSYSLKYAFFKMCCLNKSLYNLNELDFNNLKNFAIQQLKSKKISDETRLKMSLSAKNRFIKYGNPRKNMIAITDGTTTVYINKNDDIPDGWFRGNASIGKHPKHTIHKKHVIKDILKFKEQKSKLVSGKNNPMYNKGYKIAGGNNGKAKTRYYIDNLIFETRKELCLYLINNGFPNITTSVLMHIERGDYKKLLYKKFSYIINNLKWESKDENKKDN